MSFRTRKVRWEQFLLLLSSIGCLAYAGIYWFATGNAGTECQWRHKIVGLVMVIIVCILLIFGAHWLAFYW